MAERLGPPPKKADERFDNWVFRLWKRAFGALDSGDIGVTAPIVITTSGTGTLNIGHGTSGAITGTYGSQSAVPILAISTYGHVTLATSSSIALAGTSITGSDLTVSSPLTGTATNALLRAGTIGHGTSGVIGGTYGGTLGLPQVIVDTYGHITAGTSFPLQATSPILLGSNAGTFTWGHSTSGITPGTYGGADSIPQIVVDTYGHITAVNTSAVSFPALSHNVQNGGYILATTDLGGFVHRLSTATGIATWTVPSTLGTQALISLVNEGTGNVIVTAVGTLVFAGTGATGNRILPRYGMASVISLATDNWMISGAGVS